VKLEAQRKTAIRKRDAAISGGVSLKVAKVLIDRVTKLDTQIAKARSEIGTNVRFGAGKEFTAEQQIAGQDFQAGQGELTRGATAEQGRLNRAARAEQARLGRIEGSPLAKLQTALTRQQDALEKGRTEDKLSPKAESKLVREIEETKAGIKKQNFITGTTESDFRVNVNAADASAIESEMANRRIGVEQMNAARNRVRAILDTNPDANTFIARTAVFARGLSQNFKAVARRLNMDISKVHFNPKEFTGDLSALGTSNVRLQSIGISMAFALAVARNQTGKALSDSDLQLFFRELGINREDPELIMASLDEVVNTLATEARISHNGFFNSEDRPFEPFSFEQGGTPIPGVTPIVPSGDTGAGGKSVEQFMQELRGLNKEELKQRVFGV